MALMSSLRSVVHASCVGKDEMVYCFNNSKETNSDSFLEGILVIIREILEDEKNR